LTIKSTSHTKHRPYVPAKIRRFFGL
jgi:hypothetical protein